MTRSLSIVFLLVSLTVNAAAQTRGTAGRACDRECLRRMITQYLDSLVAHDPKILPTAPNVKFTEGTKTMQLGEGLWKTASKIRSLRNFRGRRRACSRRLSHRKCRPDGRTWRTRLQ